MKKAGGEYGLRPFMGRSINHRNQHHFDALARHVEQYPPAKVAEITSVEEAKIVEATCLIATNKPAGIFTFIGLAMSSNSLDTIRFLGMLSAITGNIVQDMHDSVVYTRGHWYLPEEKDLQKRIWGANINILTRLGDDYDPVIGGLRARCLLCRIRKASGE